MSITPSEFTITFFCSRCGSAVSEKNSTNCVKCGEPLSERTENFKNDSINDAKKKKLFNFAKKFSEASLKISQDLQSNENKANDLCGSYQLIDSKQKPNYCRISFENDGNYYIYLSESELKRKWHLSIIDVFLTQRLSLKML